MVVSNLVGFVVVVKFEGGVGFGLFIVNGCGCCCFIF